MKRINEVIVLITILLAACAPSVISRPTVTLNPAVIPSLISTLQLVSTETATSDPSLTQTIEETPLPTLITHDNPFFSPYVTPGPTIIAPPKRSSELVLPAGLTMEEYPISERSKETINDLVIRRHPESGGWYLWPKGGMIGGKLFQANEKDDGGEAEIHATLGDKEIFVTKCGAFTALPTVITAWVYAENWVIQSFCQQKFDVLWDGKSLNQTKNYQSSFAFQLLAGKPFYLFKKDNQVGFYYNGEEILLGYDNVKLNYCCMSYMPPQHYENMISFLATRKDQLYDVVIGRF